MKDEPSNFLDLKGIEALGKQLKYYKGTNAFISHDKRLIDNVATIVYLFRLAILKGL